MKTLLLSLSLLTLVGCASMNEKVFGYDGNERNEILASVKGKDKDGVKSTIGEPVAEGMCKACGRSEGVYEMIYLRQTLPRYSLALSMANKSELGCFILSLYYDKTVGKHVYDGGFMDQLGCAGQNGTINSVRAGNR